jgi:DIRP
MCLVFPAGCARPRRLSTRFLAAERNELARYREDARAVLRGRPLDKGVDEASGVPLGRLWWHRYPFEIPLPPKRGAVVFVKSGDGFALPAGEKRKQGAVTARASAVSKGAPGNGGRVRGQPENVTFYQGKFLSVAPNGKVTIHVDRTSCASSPHVVVTVPDLNVMSVVEPAMPVESPRCSAPVQPVTSQPSAPLGDAQDASENTISASATASAASFAASVQSTLPSAAVIAHLQATAAAVAAEAVAAGEYDNPADRHVCPGQPCTTLPLPLPLPSVTGVVTPSPRKAVAFKARSGANVEYEVHVRAVAEALRLLDRKGVLVADLGALNSDAERAIASEVPIHERTRSAHAGVVDALATINARLDIVLPGLQCPPAAARDEGTGTQGSEPRVAVSLPAPPSGPSIFDYPPAVENEDDDDFACQHDGEGNCPRASCAVSRLRDGARGLLRNSTSLGPGGQQHAFPFGNADGLRPSARDQQKPNASIPSDLGLRPEHMARNVDFRSAAGAALLSKALARSALANLPDDSSLKTAPASQRADVIECVSTCVAVLLRARATRSSESIDELADALRVKCAENESLLGAIKSAVREFDSSTSSDSRDD